MITTSYFAKIENIAYPLSICGRAPSWYTGPQYKKLAPKIEFFNQYKANEIDADEYTQEFNRLVLEPLDANVVLKDLLELAGPNATLLCYEKPNDFCHRHLVADWLNRSLNLNIAEMQFKSIPVRPAGKTLWEPR